MSKIYHYTSIESLALILDSKKIRFSSLNTVDDIQEAQSHVGIDFGQYFYVSCWTKTKAESIPQWRMYGNDMKGVRITMVQNPFFQIPIQTAPESGFQINGEMLAPLTKKECEHKDYTVMPLFFDNAFSGAVEYIEDIESRYKIAIHKEHDNSITIKDLFTLPRLKSKVWKFQDEFRFNLFALPTTKEIHKARYENIPGILLSNTKAKVSYIDVPLALTSFNDMEITLGPKTTLAEKLIVRALLNKYAYSAVIKDSSLQGKIR